jgi:hypothetical protein
MFDSDEDSDFFEDEEYPEELEPAQELSDSISDIIERLERVRRRLDDFTEEYLEANKETRESMELPCEWSMKTWVAFTEQAGMELNGLSDPI